MTSATTSNWQFELASTASPEVWAAIEEVFSVSGLGQTNEQIDVTSFDSAGSREFIGGLADGQEMTVEANYYPTAAQQANLKAAVEAKTNRNFRLRFTGSSPEDVFTFTGSPLSWVIGPSSEDKNTITFTVKISGAIT